MELNNLIILGIAAVIILLGVILLLKGKKPNDNNGAPDNKNSKAIIGGENFAELGAVSQGAQFVAEAHFFSKEEGGRRTPLSNGYRPQLRFDSADIAGEVEFESENKIVMPGDTVLMKVTTDSPISINDGDRFAIHEGDRTVGSGVVTEIVK